jgi:Fic family protein
MEPLYPVDESGELEELATTLIRSAGALSNASNPIIRNAVAGLIRPMNSYYSNLLEGHDTHPLDIEKALKSDFSNDKRRRDLQLEAKAHINLHEAVTLEWKSNKLIHSSPYSTHYILGLHERFYAHLPTDFLTVISQEGEEKQVCPGKIRSEEVRVSNHIAPAAQAVPDFLDRFESGYAPSHVSNKQTIKRIINIGAAHHRLSWIHPFLDGNGRVVRLFSDACFMFDDLDASGIWSISRGLARNNTEYYERLSNADMKRHGDHDGRGNLSNKMLVEFCRFFLTTAIDQIQFMHNSLEMDKMTDRVKAFVNQMIVYKGWRSETTFLLTDIFVKGKISKTDAMRLTNLSDKTLKLITDVLTTEELIQPIKEGKEMTFHARFPVKYSPLLFPNLYPSSKEADLLNHVFA